MSAKSKSFSLPIFPLKQAVLFPSVLMPVTIGRPASIKAFEEAAKGDEKQIVVLAQKSAEDEDPGEEGLYRVGTRAQIQKLVELEGGVLEALLLGLDRVEAEKVAPGADFLSGSFRALPLEKSEGPEIEAMRRELVETAGSIFKLSGMVNMGDAAQVIAQAEDPERLTYLLAAMMLSDYHKAQEVLEARSLSMAMRAVLGNLGREAEVLRLRRNIASHAQHEISKEQREYLLRQQLKAIQQELGEKSPEEAETAELRKRMEQAALPEAAKKEAERELDRLAQIPSASPEHSIIRGYLDFILDLPWHSLSTEALDIAKAREVLEEDHAGLKDVKARILEQLGVLKLNPEAKAPILCLVGAPGVGKTSLGQSIARALGRRFERMSLGGMHDEAELRGHRRTYIGAMPGRILQALRRAGVRNPLLMLDEVDKLGRDFRGDPAAALLEVLDPEQNASFHDNYLDLPFDLSKVLFITTANSLDGIPAPLLDRMELIRLPGYSNQEKRVIAERYLLPRQLKQSGLKPEQCELQAEALGELISRYTREAGVRQLERAIGKIYRKVALKFAESPSQAPLKLGVKELSEYLGPAPFFEETLRKELSPGVAAGLAWTEAGGEVLYVECASLPGSRGLTLTGQLGDVMQESARAAYSWVWSQAEKLDIPRDLLRRSGVHLHVPAGAVPKDGPSAGITMAVALASLLSGSPVRGDTAMTGEITLSGLLLPVGGIKEKVLAAHRAGVRRILMAKENEKDLEEVPEELRKSLEFVLVGRAEEALKAVLLPKPSSAPSLKLASG